MIDYKKIDTTIDSTIDYIKERIKEASSLHGGALIAMGVIILLGSPLISIAAYAAIAWGVFAIVKKD